MLFIFVIIIFALLLLFWHFKGREIVKNQFDENHDKWGMPEDVKDDYMFYLNLELYTGFGVPLIISFAAIFFKFNPLVYALSMFIVLPLIWLFSLGEPARIEFPSGPTNRIKFFEVWNYIAYRNKYKKNFNLLPIFNRADLTLDEIQELNLGIKNLDSDKKKNIEELLKQMNKSTLISRFFNSLSQNISKTTDKFILTLIGTVSLSGFVEYILEKKITLQEGLTIFLPYIIFILIIFGSICLIIYFIDKLSNINRETRMKDILFEKFNIK